MAITSKRNGHHATRRLANQRKVNLRMRLRLSWVTASVGIP